MTENISIDTSKMTFEEAMRELDIIVRHMDAGDVSLDESLALYNKGKVLEAFCREKLEKAKLQVDKISEEGGSPIKVSAPDLENQL